MPTKTVDPIIQRLESLAAEMPELEHAARIYAVLLPLLCAADLHVLPISMTKDEAHAKLYQGLPLLTDVDLDLDERAAGELMIQLARAVEHVPMPAARPIRRALEQGRLETRALLPRVAAGDRGYVSILAEGLQLESSLVWTIAQNALKPALGTWCRQLTPFIEGVEWEHGFCPICGTAATLGELRANEQVKYLRCAPCGADWSFPRLQCIYCGNRDHETLSYFYPEGEREKRRIEVCEQCGGYIKVIAAFSGTPADLLPVEDLATLRLDYVAQERGYARVEMS